jgi:hypothetical protein
MRTLKIQRLQELFSRLRFWGSKQAMGEALNVISESCLVSFADE